MLLAGPCKSRANLSFSRPLPFALELPAIRPIVGAQTSWMEFIFMLHHMSYTCYAACCPTAAQRAAKK